MRFWIDDATKRKLIKIAKKYGICMRFKYYPYNASIIDLNGIGIMAMIYSFYENTDTGIHSDHMRFTISMLGRIENEKQCQEHLEKFKAMTDFLNEIKPIAEAWNAEN